MVSFAVCPAKVLGLMPLLMFGLVTAPYIPYGPCNCSIRAPFIITSMKQHRLSHECMDDNSYDYGTLETTCGHTRGPFIISNSQNELPFTVLEVYFQKLILVSIPRFASSVA